MTRTTGERLWDIRDAARDLMNIVGTLDSDAMHALPNADRMVHRAIKNALAELGEAVQALPREVTDRHADIDWRGFAGLRDVVAHGSFGLRRELLWPIVREDVPRLMEAVEEEQGRPARPG